MKFQSVRSTELSEVHFEVRVLPDGQRSVGVKALTLDHREPNDAGVVEAVNRVKFFFLNRIRNLKLTQPNDFCSAILDIKTGNFTGFVCEQGGRTRRLEGHLQQLSPEEELRALGLVDGDQLLEKLQKIKGVSMFFEIEMIDNEIQIQPSILVSGKTPEERESLINDDDIFLLAQKVGLTLLSKMGAVDAVRDGETLLKIRLNLDSREIFGSLTSVDAVRKFSGVTDLADIGVLYQTACSITPANKPSSPSFF